MTELERPIGPHYDLHEPVPARPKGTPAEEEAEILSLGWKPVEFQEGEL